MARKNTTTNQGHSHSYTDQVSSPNRSTQTSIDQDHDHKVVRDDAGRAIRIARAGTPPHTHKIT